MSKLACYCGAIIRNTAYPSETEACIHPQKADEKNHALIAELTTQFLDAVSRNQKTAWLCDYFDTDVWREIPTTVAESISDIRMDIERDYVLSACECKECGRLYIQNAPDENVYKCYEPREDKYCGVFDSDK